MGDCRVGPVAPSNRRELTYSFSHKELVQVECDLLVSRFNDPKTVALVKENIMRISDGSSSHLAGVLQLGFEKAFEKKKRLPPGAKLRCSWEDCPSYSDLVLCSSLGKEVYHCKTCSNYLRCAGCGYKKTGSHTTCKQCGKVFI